MFPTFHVFWSNNLLLWFVQIVSLRGHSPNKHVLLLACAGKPCLFACLLQFVSYFSWSQGFNSRASSSIALPNVFFLHYSADPLQKKLPPTLTLASSAFAGAAASAGPLEGSVMGFFWYFWWHFIWWQCHDVLHDANISLSSHFLPGVRYVLVEGHNLPAWFGKATTTDPDPLKTRLVKLAQRYNLKNSIHSLWKSKTSSYTSV